MTSCPYIRMRILPMVFQEGDDCVKRTGLRPPLRSQAEPSCRLCLMLVVMVSQPSFEATTDQGDETSAQQYAEYLQRPFCPAIHFRDCHEADRRFAVDDLDRIASIDTEQWE